jgi:hypothetical protein
MILEKLTTETILQKLITENILQELIFIKRATKTTRDKLLVFR